MVALCAVAVCLSGAFQVAFASFRLARLITLVPQPVLAGFMNSAALLVVLAQVPLLLGLPLGSRPDPETSQPVALVLGLATAALIWGIAHRWPRLPAPRPITRSRPGPAQARSVP